MRPSCTEFRVVILLDLRRCDGGRVHGKHVDLARPGLEPPVGSLVAEGVHAKVQHVIRVPERGPVDDVSPEAGLEVLELTVSLAAE